MYEKYGQFIDGKWHKSSTGETYEVINPANEEIIGKASKASPEDVDKALLSAQKGLEVWKKTPPWQRAYILRRIADKMREKQDILAKWMTLEVGKPFAEAKGEVNGAADIYEWNAEETKRIYGQTVESRFEDTRVHVYYQPVGVVAALVPWNFPLVLSARKISTALAAGCSVIVKPDVITPGVVMEQVEICRGVITLMPVIIGTGSCAKCIILSLPAGIIVSQCNHCRRAYGHSIRAKRQRFGNIGAGANAARDHELYLTMHTKVLQRSNSRPDASKGWLAYMFDKNILRCCSAALHAVNNNDISPRFDRKCGIKIRARSTNLDIDRLFPIGDFT